MILDPFSRSLWDLLRQSSFAPVSVLRHFCGLAVFVIVCTCTAVYYSYRYVLTTFLCIVVVLLPDMSRGKKGNSKSTVDSAIGSETLDIVALNDVITHYILYL